MTTTIARPLGLLDSITLTEQVEARLQALEDYDLSAVVSRLKRKQLLPEYLIDDAAYEFKRLMALCVIGHRGIVVPCEPVDEVWHTFMLFTREYAEFCRRVAGGFLHHSPPESTLVGSPSGEDFLTLYRRYFGPTFESEVQKLYLAGLPPICQSSVACGID